MEILFAVLNGFKFPNRKTSKILIQWSEERKQFENYVQQLTKQQPIELLSLTRIKIRQHLKETFSNSTVEFKQKYRAKNDKSTLQQMTEQLEIPKKLQEFLIDFYDCASVMTFYALNGN